MSEYLTIYGISLDSETVRLSHAGEQPSSGWHEDRIIQAGHIKREVPYLPGSAIISDCHFRVSNEGNYLSKLKASNPVKNREVQIQFGKRSEGESELTTIFTGRIEDVDIKPEDGLIRIRDASYERFQDPCPGKMNRVDFPGLPVDSPLYMAPIILGEVSSVGASAIGAVPCYLTTTANPFRYLVAQHACKSIVTVYLYGSALAPAAYSVTTSAVGARTYTFIDFTTDQRDSDRPNEFEITADVQGLMDGASNLITNPAEALEEFLTDFCAVSSSYIDATRFAAADTAADDESYAVGAWIGGEGEGIPKMIDVINNFSRSFMMPFFVNRSGEYAIKLLIGSDFFDLPSGSEPEITDNIDILQQQNDSRPDASSSFQVLSNREVASTIKYSYFRQWVDDYYEETFDHVNNDEETNLGRTVVRDRALLYVRDIDTANKVIATRLLFLTEGKQFAKLKLPVSHFTKDLLDYINITHYAGVESDGWGYQLATFMIIGLDIAPDPTGMEIVADLVRVVDSIPHCDSHSDQHADSEHTDSEHGDAAHSDSYSDAEHADEHTDVHIDRHADTTCTYQGHDDLTGHGDAHCDHDDLWYHHDDHQDAYNYPYDYMDEHADYHSDYYSDVPHQDSAHSDSYGDSAHSDTPHQDVSHTDTDHSDFHCDNDTPGHDDHTDGTHEDHSDIFEIGV